MKCFNQLQKTIEFRKQTKCIVCRRVTGCYILGELTNFTLS